MKNREKLKGDDDHYHHFSDFTQRHTRELRNILQIHLILGQDIGDLEDDWGRIETCVKNQIRSTQVSRLKQFYLWLQN